MTGLIVDPVQREDFGGMDDRRVETGFGGLVEEDTVEHLAGRGVEAEGDVRQTKDRAHAREFRLDPPDRFERLDAVTT